MLVCVYIIEVLPNGVVIRWYSVVGGVSVGIVCWDCGTICEAWLTEGVSLDKCCALWQAGDVTFVSEFRGAEKVFRMSREAFERKPPHGAHQCYTRISVRLKVKDEAIIVLKDDFLISTTICPNQ